eukprot:s3772_g3.t1
MATNRSWVHAYFWEKRPDCGDYRCCKLCYPKEDEQPPASKLQELLAKGARPGLFLHGTCLNQGTPAIMQNHIRDHHPESLPNFASTGRRAAGGLSHGKIDPVVMRDFALDVVIAEMLPVRKIDSPHFRRFLTKYISGLGSRKVLQQAVNTTILEIEHEVKCLVQAAKCNGIKFHLSADAWKPKMKRGCRHYLAIMLNWCDENFDLHSVCISSPAVPPPRTGEKYHATFVDALQAVDLAPTDILLTSSDHESAVRKGMNLLKAPTIGCAAHALQLCCKHSMPPLRGGGDSSSDEDSSSSSDSTSSSSSDEEVPVGQKKKPGRKPDEARVAMKQQLKPIFKPLRQTVRYYMTHLDDYERLEKIGSERQIPFIAYGRETACRWNSTLTSMMTVVHNNKVHQINKSLHQLKAPEPLTSDQMKEADVSVSKSASDPCSWLNANALILSRAICPSGIASVLYPLRRATDLVQGSGEKSLASVYVPVWFRLTETYRNPRQFAVPATLRAAHGESVPVRSLPKAASDLSKFLKQDLAKVWQQHLGSTAGEDWLYVASYLDPRFKQMSYCNADRMGHTRKMLEELCMTVAEKYPQLQHPENRPLVALLHDDASKPKKTRKRKQVEPPKAKPTTQERLLPHGPGVSQPRRALKLRKSDENWLRQNNPIIPPDADGQEQALVELSEVMKREIAAYDAQPAQEIDVSPLQWWKQFSKQSNVPHLTRVAQMAFSIPASTSDLERLFSHAGLMVTHRKPRLQAKTASKMIAAHCNVSRGLKGKALDTKDE